MVMNVGSLQKTTTRSGGYPHISTVDIILSDDGAGNLGYYDLSNVFQNVGTINYTNGEITINPSLSPDSTFFNSSTWSIHPNSTTYLVDGEIRAKYYTTGYGATARSKVFDSIPISLTFGIALNSDIIVPQSLRFRWGTTMEYRDVNGDGLIYRHSTPWPSDNSGIIYAGTLSYNEKIVTLTNYVINPLNQISVLSCLTKIGNWPSSYAYGRTPGSPLRPASFYIQCTTNDGRELSGTADVNGVIEETEIHGVINQDMGVFELNFGQSVLDSTLTAEEKAEPWYDPADIDEFGYIWQPTYVLTDTLKMNGVIVSTLPLSALELGLDPSRLPITGKVPIFKPGRRICIHHTEYVTLPNPAVAGSTINCGRTGLARVYLEDALGRRVPDDRIYPGEYVLFSTLTPEQKATYEYWEIRDDGTVWFPSTTDLDAGTIELASPLDLTGYDEPLKLYHTIEDSALVTTSDLSGLLSINRVLLHDYPKDETLVSSQLYFGDVWSRYTNLFSQATWTSVWSDDQIGSNTSGQFNESLYPILTTNNGTIEERWRVTFTSSTNFSVYGERSGLIATGSTTLACSPLNPSTNSPYFTIPYEGWGTGWVTGNTIRFNTFGPRGFWLARCVNPGPAYGDSDSVGITFRGDSEPA